MADDQGDSVEVTDEQKLKIAQHFLLSSPPGQFNDVLSDLKELMPSGLLTDKLVADIIKNYHAANGKVLPNGEGKGVLVHKYAEVDPTHYIDSSIRRVVGVDHVAGVVLSQDSREVKGEMDGTLETERAELAKAVADYVATQYVTETATSGVYAIGGNIFVVIYGERLNLRNYWSGSWLSAWKVDLTDGPVLSGSVKIRAHYFEEGNVQLQTTKTMPGTTLSSSGTEWTGAAVEAIKTFEQDLHAGLGNMYTNMGDETFKAMRRKMLLSRQKFEWNINAHRVAKTLGGGK